MGLHKAGSAVVVPVVLEKCRWNQTELGCLNALPEKAMPLNSWKPQSNGWNSVANGLAIVFKKLMKKNEAINQAEYPKEILKWLDRKKLIRIEKGQEHHFEQSF
jgi:hypothetical protein